MSLVLVVEDDAPFRRLACAVLGRAGYRTCQAADGEEALQVLAQRPVGLVLLDVDLPKVSGGGVLDGLANHPLCRDVPVILMTALGDAEVEKHVNDPRVRAVLLKTRFSLADLRAQVRRALPLAG
jgi:two-component system, OmpR family, phosphate regulon response regulator PhoB